MFLLNITLLNCFKCSRFLFRLILSMLVHCIIDLMTWNFDGLVIKGTNGRNVVIIHRNLCSSWQKKKSVYDNGLFCDIQSDVFISGKLSSSSSSSSSYYVLPFKVSFSKIVGNWLLIFDIKELLYTIMTTWCESKYLVPSYLVPVP